MEEWVTALAITLGVAHMAFDDCVSWYIKKLFSFFKYNKKYICCCCSRSESIKVPTWEIPSACRPIHLRPQPSCQPSFGLNYTISFVQWLQKKALNLNPGPSWMFPPPPPLRWSHPRRVLDSNVQLFCEKPEVRLSFRNSEQFRDGAVWRVWVGGEGENSSETSWGMEGWIKNKRGGLKKI